MATSTSPPVIHNGMTFVATEVPIGSDQWFYRKRAAAAPTSQEAQDIAISQKASVDATNHADDNAAKAAHTEDAIVKVAGEWKAYNAETDSIETIGAAATRNGWYAVYPTVADRDANTNEITGAVFPITETLSTLTAIALDDNSLARPTDSTGTAWTQVGGAAEVDAVSLAALGVHGSRVDNPHSVTYAQLPDQPDLTQLHDPAPQDAHIADVNKHLPDATGQADKVPVSALDGSYTLQDRIQVSPANYVVGFGAPATLAPPKAGVYYEQIDAVEGANNVWGPTDAAGAFPAQADNRSADIAVLQDATVTTGAELTDPRRMSVEQIDQRIQFNGNEIDLSGLTNQTLTNRKLHVVDNTTTLDLAPGAVGDRAWTWNTQTEQLDFYRHNGTNYIPDAPDHDHEVLENIAVYIFSGGTNAGSQAAIEFFDLDGVAYPPTDWTVSSSATGVASRTGNVTPPFVDQSFTGTYVMGHNKNDFIYFKYIGDSANGLSAITYAGTNGANSDGQIIVNYSGTNYHVDFANKAAVEATPFTKEAEATSTEEGLRGAPVADITALKALTARDDERRRTSDGKRWTFTLGATSGDHADDAATGFWDEIKIYTSIAANEIGSLKQVPNVKEDGSAKVNADYVAEGLLPLVDNYTLTDGATSNPKFAFMFPTFVNGNDLRIPSGFGGRFVRNLGGNASASMALQADGTAVNGLRTLRTYVQSDWNGQSNNDFGKGSGSITGAANNGVGMSSSDPETRPHNFAMQFCLVLDSYAKEMMVEADLVAVDDRQAVETIMPSEGGSGSGSNAVYNYPQVEIALAHSGKHAIRVLPHQTTTSLESGSKVGGTFTVKDISNAVVGTLVFPSRNWDATYTDLPYVGGAQELFLDLPAGTYKLDFVSAAGSGAGNRTSSDGFVQVITTYEDVKTVATVDEAATPVDTTEVGTPLQVGSERHYVMQWDGTKLVNTLAKEVWTEGTIGNSGYRKYMIDHLLGHARIAGRNVITSTGTISWNLDFALASAYVFAHDLREAQAETASMRINSRTVNSLQYTLHDSVGTGDAGSNVQFELSGDL